MCGVVPLLTAASAGVGLYRAERNADRQAAAVRQAAEIQQDEINDQLSVEANQRARAARAERARIRAASAETGLTGTTIGSLLRDVDFQAGMDIALMEQNAGNRQRAADSQTRSRLNAIPQPDFIGTALNAGLQIYRYNNPPGSTPREPEDGGG